ncbi:MAG: enoyl-CoA hydratase/isomerase family protein [Gammaproteobacteria bacterium]|nr:enoyl-CoA hydratase/isomerase family protein [Gammaproteobacteria bacterium]MBQ0840332.1 enoyl-CoA hydratase/isomerase family protein [Gammaproteobacteria bacterium]
MRTTDSVIIDDSHRVRTITLNRPAALNAFNDDQYDGAGDALSEAATDDDIAVVIITGAGRAFTAGQDLDEMANPRQHSDGKRHGFPYFIDTLASFPKPVIAAVNGIGVGIGLTMLPHCDFVFMSETARLKAPFPTLGVTVEAGNSFLLPERVGWANAAHILYTAEWVDADKAVGIGLAWKKTSADQLLPEAARLAQQIAAMPITSLVHTKNLVLAPRLDALKAARKRETAAFVELVGAPANREAIAAFKEKRAADFSNLPKK